jgi:hypothetical protein
MRRRRPTPLRPDVPERPDLPPAAAPPAARRRRGRRLVAAIAATVLVAATVGGAVVGAVWAPTPEHAFLAVAPDGSPYRWNPCAPIHYQLNLEGAPGNAPADTREALRRLTDASGIRFVDDGSTTRTDDDQRASGFRDPATGGWYPVLVAWLPAREFRRWADPRTIAGVGLPYSGTGDDAHVYRSGMIVLNADAGEPSGFRGRFSQGVLLMHEWAHVLGLGHVRSAHELMWSDELRGAAPVPDLAQDDWGPGDLEGLAEVGRPAGCLRAA